MLHSTEYSCSTSSGVELSVLAILVPVTCVVVPSMLPLGVSEPMNTPTSYFKPHDMELPSAKPVVSTPICQVILPGVTMNHTGSEDVRSGTPRAGSRCGRTCRWANNVQRVRAWGGACTAAPGVRRPAGDPKGDRSRGLVGPTNSQDHLPAARAEHLSPHHQQQCSLATALGVRGRGDGTRGRISLSRRQRDHSRRNRHGYCARRRNIGLQQQAKGRAAELGSQCRPSGKCTRTRLG